VRESSPDCYDLVALDLHGGQDPITRCVMHLGRNPPCLTSGIDHRAARRASHANACGTIGYFQLQTSNNGMTETCGVRSPHTRWIINNNGNCRKRHIIRVVSNDIPLQCPTTSTPLFWYRSRASDFFSVELTSPGSIFAGSVHRTTVHLPRKFHIPPNHLPRSTILLWLARNLQNAGCAQEL